MNRFASVLTSVLFCVGGLCGQVVPQWNRPEKPFRIADNLYYVGTNFLASYLITTPQGNILINPDYEESVPLIEASVAAVGQKFSDVKIILISHAHDDHAAGCARAKKDSGAQLMVMDRDVPLIESGGQHDFAYKTHYPPAKVDRVLHDGDTVQLGGVTLVAHLTAGHTKGCTTWTTEVTDHGKKLHAVILGSLSVNPGYQLMGNPQYPEIATDYEKSFRTLRGLACDLFLGAHGSYFNLEEKRAKMREGNANPFVDPSGYREFINHAQAAFQKELRKQEAGLTRNGTSAHKSGGGN